MRRFISVLAGLLFVFAVAGCSLFASFDTEKSENYESKITGVSLSASSVSVGGGDSEYITLSMTPADLKSKVTPHWTYDSTYITLDGDSSGAVITGVKTGSTYLKCMLNNIVATCLVTVTSDASSSVMSPYIYSDVSVVELTPGSIQTVSVSLYNGTSAQYENFEWSIKDSSVAEISSARNNCVIKAKATGSTQVVAHHPDSEYDYSFVVFVHADTAAGVPYITTDCNVISINRMVTKERNVNFSVKNVADSGATQFTYSDTSSDPGAVSIAGSGSQLLITPLRTGTAHITVRNSACDYPLDVIVIVSSTVNNVYVTTSDSTVVVDGSDTVYNVYAYLNGYDGICNPDDFHWIMPSDSKYQDCADFQPSGNGCRIQGKKNGVFKIKVWHELAGESLARTVLVVLRNQAGSAKDASMYITTTKNYIQTKVGAETTDVTVDLVGGIAGDENDFIWTIDNGPDNDLVKIETTTGTVKSRSAVSSGTDAYGILHITPNISGKTGTVKITAGHVKCLYTTDIIVKVYSKYAQLEPAVELSVTDSTGNAKTVLSMLNSSGGVQLNAALKNEKTAGAENSISWSSSDASKISLTPDSGTYSLVKPCGTGTGFTYVTVSHKDAVASKRILVITADTQEALDTAAYIFADNTYYRGNVGKSFTMTLGQVNINSEKAKNITWKSSNQAVCTVNADSTHLSPSVTGTGAGEAVVTASYAGCPDVEFSITILPEGEDTGVIKPKYLTTTLNAVVIEKTGGTAELSVTGISVPDADMQKTVWSVVEGSNKPADAAASGNIVQLSANGGTCTITAVQQGKCRIRVTNPVCDKDDKNADIPVFIDVKVGAVYEWQDDTLIYITTETDTVLMVNGETKTVGAKLANSTLTDGFSWSASPLSSSEDDRDVIGVTGTDAGTCIIETKKAGKEYIEIANKHAEPSAGGKEILVVVANSAAELAGVEYLTTNQNVVTVGEKNTLTVSVSVKNASNPVLAGYTWESDSPDTVSVVGSGAVAVISGNKIGSAKIKVTNSECSYPLEIIATCVDPVVAAANPYITCSNIITVTVGGDAAELTADLVGGNKNDYPNFTWKTADSSVVSLYSSNETAKIKGVKEGVTQIVISHPKAAVQRTVLVICEAASKTKYYITSSESIITVAPDSGTKSISATLVNGDNDDAYDFRWWADNYDIIDMNYTADVCTVTPKQTGTVNIYCSHPKAANTKTIVFTITKYSSFKFSQNNISLDAGTNSFVTVQTPETSSGSKVVFTSEDPGIVTIGASTAEVCTLIPVKEGNTTVTGQMFALDSGKLLGTTSLFVYVKPAETDPVYIRYTGSTLTTVKKGETLSLSASLCSSSAVSGDDDNLVWTLSPDNGVARLSPGTVVAQTAAGAVRGSVVKITAVQEGNTVISISHPKCPSRSRLIYILVPGSKDPSITLDRSSIPAVLGASSAKLSATITNGAADDYSKLIWTVSDEKIATISGSGKTISVNPVSVGECTVTATVNSFKAAQAVCKIKVTRAAGLVFSRDNILIKPNSSVEIEFTVTPPEDKVFWTLGDSKFISFSGGETHDASSGKGKLLIIGKSEQGTTNITGTTSSGAHAQIIICNDYKYLLTVDKTLISTTPDRSSFEASGKSQTMCIKYQVRPADAQVSVSGMRIDDYLSRYLTVDTSASDPSPEGIKGPYRASEIKDGAGYTDGYLMNAADRTVDEVSGIATGYIVLKCTGEVNSDITVNAKYPADTLNGDSFGGEGAAKIHVAVYYPKLDIIPMLPTTSSVGIKNISGKYSRWNTFTGSMVLGDGETVSFSIACTQKNCDGQPLSVAVKNYTFTPNRGEQEIMQASKKLVSGDSGDTQGARIRLTGSTGGTFMLYHNMDYGWNGGSYPSLDYLFGEGPYTSADLASESVNTAVRLLVQSGTVDITYHNYASGSDNIFKIKVFSEVRNSRMY